MSDTDIAYAGTDVACGTSPRVCYAMSGIDIAYAAPRTSSGVAVSILAGSTRYVQFGTDMAYAAPHSLRDVRC
eukprot:2598983-Rhodomonas_salina.1